MAITVKIAGVDRTEYINARSFSIIDELTSKVNSASFNFICNSKTVAPTAGETVLIEEGTTKLFSGRILSKKESFFPPDRLKYKVECIDYTRDLDKKLVIESYLNQTAGAIIKDIIDNYTTGFTYANVSDGPTITKINFDYIQVSEAITKIAEATGYEWYVDYDKDLYFFLRTDYPASWQLDDTQGRYKDLVIDYDISQLRNRVYVKSEKYETLDFTELFIGDGSTVTWTCKYQANAKPSPSATLDDVAKTVGWDGVDDPALFNYMLNSTTKVLSLGTGEPTPADGAELAITYGADQAIIVRWDDQDSIDAVIAIEGGDGIFEHCITDNNIDTKEWAIDVAKADLLQNADPVIRGTFTTNESNLRAGQLITLNSTKRNLNQTFLIQKIKLVRILPVIANPSIPYRPAATATIGYKSAATATEGYKNATTGEMIYYVYQVTIATKLKGLEDLILDLLYQSNESLKRDTTAPDVPTGLALSTGMGKVTQASLAWIKAEWNANTEDDFSHYELKYKKSSYSDFGLVTTTNTTFLFINLEQNVEYQVYIRGVDIYGNRSAWSSVQSQTTATDTDTPAQTTGATATAIVAGIKVNWTANSEANIAEYIVERQESDDGTTWTAGWVEMTRIKGLRWQDSLLPYTKYYRYRISAITQTGTTGATSTPTANSIKALQVDTDDVAADAITANEINVTNLAAISADMGSLTAGDITLDSSGFICSSGKTYGGATAGFWMGYNVDKYKVHIGTNTEYLKWDGSNLNIKGDIVITGGSGIASLTDAGSLATLDEVGASNLNTTVISGGKIITGLLTATNIRTGTLRAVRVQVGGSTSEDIYFEDSGIRMYDYGSRIISVYKSGYGQFYLGLFSTSVRLESTQELTLMSAASKNVKVTAGSKNFYFYYTGTLQLPSLTSAPTGHNGDITYNSSSGWFAFYAGGQWKHVKYWTDTW